MGVPAGLLGTIQTDSLPTVEDAKALFSSAVSVHAHAASGAAASTVPKQLQQLQPPPLTSGTHSSLEDDSQSTAPSTARQHMDPQQQGSQAAQQQALPGPSSNGVSSTAPTPLSQVGHESSSAEQKAATLVQNVILESMSPESSLEALQQLNYDLTMQLGLYQQMVGRLKDAMEQADLEKAELEADKEMLAMQLSQQSADTPFAANSQNRKWGFRWPKRSDAADDIAGNLAVGDDMESASSMGLGHMSVTSSRRSSDADDASIGAEIIATDPESSKEIPKEMAKQQPASTAGKSNSWNMRRMAAALRAAPTPADQLAKELKEAKRQAAALVEENRFLVGSLVAIKMELAEAQGGGQHRQHGVYYIIS